MQVIVLGNESQKEEWLYQGVTDQVTVHWIKDAEEFCQYPEATGYIDLLFYPSPARIELLKSLPQKPVFVAYVTGTLKNWPGNFIRINGWPTFLLRSLVEASAGDNIRPEAEAIIAGFRKKAEWVADVPGLITARVVAMIINEAYFTLAEGVSTKQETDTAMKLGTNYPYGPFEWAEKIGLKNILALLQELQKEQVRYQPSSLLEKEAAT